MGWITVSELDNSELTLFSVLDMLGVTINKAINLELRAFFRKL